MAEGKLKIFLEIFSSIHFYKTKKNSSQNVIPCSGSFYMIWTEIVLLLSKTSLEKILYFFLKSIQQKHNKKIWELCCTFLEVKLQVNSFMAFFLTNFTSLFKSNIETDKNDLFALIR